MLGKSVRVAQLDRASASEAANPSPKNDEGNDLQTCPSEHQQYPQQLKADRREIDTDLGRVIDAWPSLTEAVKAGIAAMVDAAKGKQ